MNEPMQLCRGFKAGSTPAGHGFGDVSVGAASAVARLAVYAAIDSATGALTIMLINKDTQATTIDGSSRAAAPAAGLHV